MASSVDEYWMHFKRTDHIKPEYSYTIAVEEPGPDGSGAVATITARDGTSEQVSVPGNRAAAREAARQKLVERHPELTPIGG